MDGLPPVHWHSAPAIEIEIYLSYPKCKHIKKIKRVLCQYGPSFCMTLQGSWLKC
jgi:hypothetical protein